ncbi:MAG TPA: hypothetical protein VIK53_07805, partial [Verrucomicrobiae bacterium]
LNRPCRHLSDLFARQHGHPGARPSVTVTGWYDIKPRAQALGFFVFKPGLAARNLILAFRMLVIKLAVLAGNS